MILFSARGRDLVGEELSHFPRREVTALFDLVPIDELLEGLFTPIARRTVGRAGEGRHRDDLRDLDGVERAPMLSGRQVPRLVPRQPSAPVSVCAS